MKNKKGQTAIELLLFILIIFGAVRGGIYGYDNFGFYGSIIGILLGAVAGYAGLMILIIPFAIIMSLVGKHSKKKD